MINDSHLLIKRSLLVMGIAVLLAGTSYFYFDQSFSIFLIRDDLYYFRRFCRYATDLGEGGIYFSSTILIYMFARWIAPHQAAFKSYPREIAIARWWSATALIALTVVGILNHFIKISVGRQRPHRTPTFEAFHFEPGNFHWYWQSFPSGHSEVVFVMATILALLWPKHAWIFVIAAFIAFTRIATHDHFLSDVIIGSAIGYLGAHWVVYWRSRRVPAPIFDSNPMGQDSGVPYAGQ